VTTLDHIVVWVEDPLRALAFYRDVLGLAPVREADFAEGTAPFPSVRVSAESILDLTARAGAAAVDALGGVPGSAGHPVNHVCLAYSAGDFAALRERLAAHGVATSPVREGSFGAQGLAAQAFYFADPDGNVIEARWYR
jgi:glyoxylase I family protein